jgi:aspartate aminotransferase
MLLSNRVKTTSKSVTQRMNEEIQKMIAEGIHIYNLTAGQLPFKPTPEFINELKVQLNFLKSYQYSPVSGFRKLKDKLINHMGKRRGVDFTDEELGFDCIINNGSKHTLYNIFGAILNPSDEVIVLTPYWVSYPEMIKFWGGIPHVVESHAFDAYTPQIDKIKLAISPRTKAIILNSPNNPAGIHYSEDWMKQFGELMKEHPEITIISDELYSELYYFDPKPTYFYQYFPELLKQTVIVDGISKTFACTGLRVGYCIGQKELIEAIEVIQSQTTSGPSSLVQRALIDFNFNELEHFFDPVKVQLRKCAQIIREKFREKNLDHCWYQSQSGFYFMLDFTRMPFFERYKTENEEDRAEEICRDILETISVALVPGSDFGYSNSARMSLVLEETPFEEAVTRLVNYMSTP